MATADNNNHGIVYQDSQQAHPDGGFSGDEKRESLSREPSYVNDNNVEVPQEKSHALNEGSTQEYGPDGTLLNDHHRQNEGISTEVPHPQGEQEYPGRDDAKVVDHPEYERALGHDQHAATDSEHPTQPTLPHQEASYRGLAAAQAEQDGLHVTREPRERAIDEDEEDDGAAATTANNMATPNPLEPSGRDYMNRENQQQQQYPMNGQVIDEHEHEPYQQDKQNLGFAGVGAMGYPGQQDQQHLQGQQEYPQQYVQQPLGNEYGNQHMAGPDGQQQYLMPEGQQNGTRPVSYAPTTMTNTQQAIDPTSGAVPVQEGHEGHGTGALLGAGAAGAGLGAGAAALGGNKGETATLGPNTGVRPLSSSTVGAFGGDRKVQGGGLGAALATSGHDITKDDKKALKSELKTEKKFEKQLKNEAKTEGEEIGAAIKMSKMSLKKAEKAAKHESSYRSTYEKAVKKEVRAKKILLKVTAEYNKVAAELEATTKEMEMRKNGHIAAKQTYDADNQKVDALRKLKGQHDMEREAKHGDSLTKQNQAKRALSMSKRKSII